MKLFWLISVLTLFFFNSVSYVWAVCPVCTLAVGTGLGISRWLGIDDTIAGIWLGGLLISSALWLASWFEQKKWKIPYKETVSIGLILLFLIPSLRWAKILGLPNNRLWGIDKIVLGLMIGSLVFLGSWWLDKWLRKTNNNQVYIYYQKVILPVFALSIVSFIFYLITSF